MEKLKSLYIDCPSWQQPVEVDDFLVAIGIKQSNSVYHVADVRSKAFPEKRLVRYYVKVYKSDLINCLKRDFDQKLFPISWHKRPKKPKSRIQQ